MKKSLTSRYVVDVSDLIHWHHGNLSGIQRVVAEMAYRYEEEGAIFCYYDESAARFFPLDSSFTDMMNRRTATHQPVPSSAGSTVEVDGLYYIKRVSRAITPSIAMRVAKRIHREVKKLTAKESTETRKQFHFEKGDTLLVFGGHWDKPRYTATLRTAKEQASLRVGHAIMDLIPIYDQAHVAEVEHKRFPKYIQEISEISDIVYVISESTKRDYERYLKETNAKHIPKIQKIILGEDFKHSTSEAVATLEHVPYILAVGTVEVRKNYGLLYYAYKRAYELNITLPRLVIVGREGWLAGDVYYQMKHDSQVSNDITFMHGMNDHQLSWLYEHCLFTVNASFYEGWGLPIAEAAFYGKTCAASNSTSIPEVVGDCAKYFSPFSTDECLKTLQALLDRKTRERLEKRIANRRPISWDDTFRQTKEALR